MMFRLWLVLFFVFLVYTWFVYSNCDKNSLPGNNPDKSVVAGWNTWQQKNCQSCHQIYGLGGYLGPDLTNAASAPGKDDKYLKIFIQYGTGKMPNFQLSDSETNNLVAFLKWVDKSGKSRVPIESVTWTGNYNLDN
jgi:nitric oxide reductase subunit C